jgi:protein-S-isoprenylcysteine O-methyltransferase Ste14
MITPEQDSAQVTFPPPFMVIISLALGYGLYMWCPWHLYTNPNVRWVGYAAFISGIAIIVFIKGLFTKAGTAIPPWKPTTAIVRKGPYQISRNPIYICFLISGLGVALSFNNAWIALLQIPLAMWLHFAVIKKEEKYLEQKFGQPYIDFKKSVRRWI